jgi:hypothetical protein
VLLIDAANVIGSRPDGWWRDRPEAARTFVERVRAAARADRLTGPVVVVLEGASRAGVVAGEADGVRVVHAPASGDDQLVDVTRHADVVVTLVSADRGLRRRVQDLGAEVVGPRWLLGQLDG